MYASCTLAGSDFSLAFTSLFSFGFTDFTFDALLQASLVCFLTRAHVRTSLRRELRRRRRCTDRNGEPTRRTRPVFAGERETVARRRDNKPSRTTAKIMWPYNAFSTSVECLHSQWKTSVGGVGVIPKPESNPNRSLESNGTLELSAYLPPHLLAPMSLRF